jgi:hypothetical protein
MAEVIPNDRSSSMRSTRTERSIRSTQARSPDSESQSRIQSDIQEAIIRETESRTTRDAIQQEIEKLAKTSVTLEQDFAQIGWAIEEFGRSGLLIESGPEPYPERWRKLHRVVQLVQVQS